MLATDFLTAKFNVALDYPTYLTTGTPEQQRRWNAVHAATQLTHPQISLLRSFTRPMHILTVSGIWCGDCVEQVPLIEHLAAASHGRIRHRLLDRDEHKDLSSQLRINGGDRVPVVLLLSEDCDFCALAGDRSLSRYRAKAERELGAACATGLVVPPGEELAACLQDWLDEIERVQLMLRLSPRYRKKYGD